MQGHASREGRRDTEVFTLTDRSALLAVAHGKGVLLLELLNDFLRVALTFAQPATRRQHRGAAVERCHGPPPPRLNSPGIWIPRRSWQGPARSSLPSLPPASRALFWARLRPSWARSGSWLRGKEVITGSAPSAPDPALPRLRFFSGRLFRKLFSFEA
jgi:hypothetical protein